MSPVEISVPFTMRSALMIEGAEERAARFACGADAATAAAAVAVSFLLENMSASLDKGARVSNDVIVPNLIVHVRPGAAPRRSEFSDRSSFGDLNPYPH